MSKKYFNLQDDVVFSTSRINEHIRFSSGTMGLTGTLGSGTVSSPHVKTYTDWNSSFLGSPISGGFHQSVFDRNADSPAASHLFDITWGASVSSSLAVSGTANFEEKRRIYRMFAQKLLGDPTLNFVFQGKQRNELIFVLLDRNQYKDQIKPGTFEIEFVHSGNVSDGPNLIFNKRIFSDITALSSIEDTPAGPRGFLNLIKDVSVTAPQPTLPTKDEFAQYAGAVYYKEGIIALIPEVVSLTASTGGNEWFFSASITGSYTEVVSGGSGVTFYYDSVHQATRQRLLRIDFRNQTNIRNTFYTCVAERNEYNYSPNPSFTNEFGQIRTTSGSGDRIATTYITKIGLLGANGETMAVGQLNRPVRKDPDLRLEFKVRLDY